MSLGKAAVAVGNSTVLTDYVQLANLTITSKNYTTKANIGANYLISNNKPLLTITKHAILRGALIVNISNSVYDQILSKKKKRGTVVIPLVAYNVSSAKSNFTSIQFAPVTDPCKNVKVQNVYSSSTLSATISVANTCGGLSNGAVAGIVVGGAVLTAAIVAIVVTVIARKADKEAIRRVKGKFFPPFQFKLFFFDNFFNLTDHDLKMLDSK